ncbi:TnsD family Tn7-like transposition protein [Paenibacillus naphthalenovorans]|uniref:TnsD family Tn7-like transposition protein n=1 Tax=Paenibacillus naphthalenovorans TaxID=162209 RepID=UPI003D2E40D4
MNINITTFPTPYPDEELRSIIYRHVLRKGCSFLEGVQDLFGINSRRIPFLPHNMLHLYEKLPRSLFPSVNALIEKHTFYPLYSPFLSGRNRAHLYERMTEYRKGETRAASLVTSIISKEIRYCPMCMEEDEEKFGEVYIHRSHQVSGVDVCHIHHSQLISRCRTCNVVLGQLYGDSYLGTTKCINGHSLSEPIKIDKDDEFSQIKLLLAKEIHLLLNGDLRLENLFDVYGYLAKEKGYQHKGGRYINHKFRNEVIDIYPKEILERLNAPVELLESRSALRIFDERNALKNPIVHMLVIQKLMGGLQRLIEFVNFERLNEERIPFGKGAWPCINKTCHKYLSQTIHFCDWHYSRELKKYIGLFKCKECGMSYQSNCTDESLEFDIQKTKVVEYGATWHDRLKYLYKQKKSIKAISEILGADRSTIKKYIHFHFDEDIYNTNTVKNLKGSPEWLEKLYQVYDQTKSVYETALHLNTDKRVVYKYINQREAYEAAIIPSLKESAAAIETAEQVLGPREQLLLLLRDNPNISRSELGKLIGWKKYYTLMKNERDWMESVLPPADHNFKSPDWIEEDMKLSAELIQVCKKIYENPPNKQIKRYTILNHLSVRDKSRMLVKSDKFPRSVEVLKGYLETEEDFQIRVIPHTVKMYQRHYNKVTVGILLGDHRFKDCSEKVKENIRAYLEGEEG